jgi:two-component system, LytTR family, sensor kinase
LNWRVGAGICAAWILAALILSGQGALDVAMRGGQPIPWFVPFIQTLPWIPVTLGGVVMAQRFPPARAGWPRTFGAHLAAVALLALVSNVLVVGGYMLANGNSPALGALVRQGGLWAVLNLHIVLLIYAATIAATIGVMYFRQTRDRELQLAKVEGQLVRARLETLNSQIRPHFLFNTLHTIGQLWRSGRSDDADTVLDHLGSLFHKVQSSTSRFEVGLAEELDMVREYLAIEATRFRDRLQTSVMCTEAALQCHVPPLILQPIVENAIRHGISAVSTAGCVSVRAEVVEQQLHLTVYDDGPGMNAVSPRSGSGTGLRNTRERLHQLYGDGAGVHVSDGSNGGSIVRLILPVSDGTSGRRLE